MNSRFLKAPKSLGLLALALLLIFMPLITGGGYWQHLVNIMAIYAIFALGWNLLFGYAGQISFGHQGFSGIGAYGVACLAMKLHLSFWTAVPIALMLCALVAIIMGVIVLRLRGRYMAVATLAFGTAAYTVIFQWRDLTLGFDGINLPMTYFFGYPLNSNSSYYYLTLACAVVAFLICYFLVPSRVGRAFKTIRTDPNLASALGINVVKYRVLVFALSAVMAGASGILYAGMVRYITPENFSMAPMIMVLTMVVVGGVGSNTGTLMGVILITMIPEFLYAIQEYHLLIYGILVMVMLYFAPGGLIGLVHSLHRRWSGGIGRTEIRPPKSVTEAGLLIGGEEE